MATQTQLVLGLGFADIQKMNRGEDYSDIETDITELIEQHCSMIETVLKQQGFDVSEVSTTKHKRLYNMCRMIVRYRVSSEVLESFANDTSSLGHKRWLIANELERRIIEMPESCSDDWDGDKHSGSWEFESEEQYTTEQNGGLRGPNWHLLNSF